jgi:SAM-dependent methyltransferase
VSGQLALAGEKSERLRVAVKKYSRSCREVFNDWARDHHAAGMEKGHWPAVQEAFREVSFSTEGDYLEIGVGSGYGLEYMARGPFRGQKVQGIDISEEMLALTKKRTSDLENVLLKTCDFFDFPLSPSYSLIFSMEVFYYFSSIFKGIERAFQFLKPGGTLLVLVNYYEEHEESHVWPEQLNTAMQLWSKKDYFEGFQRAGFIKIGQKFFVPDERGQKKGTLGTWGQKASVLN